MQIDRKFIEDEFDKFFEFDTDDKSIVLSVSCRLFAEHIAQLAATPLQPLTDEQISNALKLTAPPTSLVLRITRAIERAHRIGAETK